MNTMNESNYMLEVIIVLRAPFSSVFHEHSVVFALPQFVPVLKPVDLPNMNTSECQGSTVDLSHARSEFHTTGRSARSSNLRTKLNMIRQAS